MVSFAGMIPDRKRKIHRKRKPVTCLRCGWTWVPYGRTTPARCANPKCRSPYWHKPRRGGGTLAPLETHAEAGEHDLMTNGLEGRRNA
jgi:hypothetical protein